MYIIIDLSKFYGGLKPKAKRVVVSEMASQKTKISSLFIFFPRKSTSKVGASCNIQITAY